MIHRLCASCGRAGAAGLPFMVTIAGLDHRHEIVGLCQHCADPARFSINQLADAIIAEFQRQLSPNINPKGGNTV